MTVTAFAFNYCYL